MTPLAYRYLKLAFCGGLANASAFIAAASNVQCFEITEIRELLGEISKLPLEAHKNTFFPPAKSCWIEWLEPVSNQRVAYFLVEAGLIVDIFGVTSTELEFLGQLRRNDTGSYTYWASSDMSDKEVAPFCTRLLCIFAAINTPKLVERTETPPHKGLVKQAKRADAELELRPSVTLKLAITPRTASGDSGDPDRLTGIKCLHFCRAHLRFRRGKLEVVRSHWRGDAAIGVKSKDYRVVA